MDLHTTFQAARTEYDFNLKPGFLVIVPGQTLLPSVFGQSSCLSLFASEAFLLFVDRSVMFSGGCLQVYPVLPLLTGCSLAHAPGFPDP